MSTTHTVTAPALDAVRPGRHVCWIYDDDATYVDVGAEILRAAAATGEKPVVFGPDRSATRAALAACAAMAADPRVDFLGSGPLDPAAMYAMFHDETASARREGFAGIRLVADMDWLLPTEPTAADVVAFELLLDRHARELDATIVCAYRRTSFAPDVLEGACCVHPFDTGAGEAPPFRLVAGDGGSWRLAGEVDIGSADPFAAAITTIAAADPACRVDVSDLAFIDVHAMATIARRAGDADVHLTGASSIFRRSWQIAGFGTDAPRVRVDA